MVTVKMLEPYYIQANKVNIRVILAFRYFSIERNNEEYQFIPLEAKEIIIDRQTKKIINIDDRFAFQSGDDIIYIEMMELIYLPDFLIQLHFIVESFFAQKHISDQGDPSDIDDIILGLEKRNIKRAIDQALDKRDEKTFIQLVRLLQTYEN